MIPETSSHPRRGAIWAGRTLSGLTVAFLLLDGLLKLSGHQAVVDAHAALGIPLGLSTGIGVLELLCVLVYAVPATSTLGAVLLTGYLGGATAIHVRVGDPLFSHVLFPTYVGALTWAGLLLRDLRLRALLLPRTDATPES